MVVSWCRCMLCCCLCCVCRVMKLLYVVSRFGWFSIVVRLLLRLLFCRCGNC